VVGDEPSGLKMWHAGYQAVVSFSTWKRQQKTELEALNVTCDKRRTKWPEDWHAGCCQVVASRYDIQYLEMTAKDSYRPQIWHVAGDEPSGLMKWHAGGCQVVMWHSVPRNEGHLGRAEIFLWHLEGERGMGWQWYHIISVPRKRKHWSGSNLHFGTLGLEMWYAGRQYSTWKTDGVWGLEMVEVAANGRRRIKWPQSASAVALRCEISTWKQK
jgi:hypothetical protein